MECGAETDGEVWLDAQLHAHVLGKKDPGVVARPGQGVRHLRDSQRPLLSRWPRPKWVRGDRMVHCGQIRPSLVRSAHLRHYPLYVRRVHRQEVQFQEVHTANVRGCGATRPDRPAIDLSWSRCDI